MATPDVKEARSVTNDAVAILQWAERAVFFIIGILLFAAAATLLVRSAQVLGSMAVGPAYDSVNASASFLDVILLVLMVVELAYTVVLSLRGAVLQAEPFLIVGLIAVIRRILVITVGEVGPSGSKVTSSIPELAILTLVVVVFVGSIFFLRTRPRRDDFVLPSGD